MLFDNISGNDFLIKYFGIIFILAGLIRIILVNERNDEMKNAGVHNNFGYFIISFEIIVGLTLLFELFDTSMTLIAVLLFLIIATLLIIINNFNKIISDCHLVWMYQPTSMCVVLHLAYIVTIIGLLLNLNQK